MKVAFIHHHMRRGGVTRVIEDQIASAAGLAGFRPLILTGESPPPSDEDLRLPFRVVSSLRYDRDRREGCDPERMADDVQRSIGSVWKEGADILHIHNPTLGKNKEFVRMVRILRSRGERVLLQIHDFAEDGRPDNYTAEEYPSDCHYAVINSRDYKILREAGLKDEGLHLLPNAVRPLRARNGNRDIVLYPVRAIRRKNVGEAVLLSLFIQKGDAVGLTLEPTGMLDVQSYEGWRSFVSRYGLPVLFGLGTDTDLSVILGRSRFVITTSIKEGFGLTFLEPWTGKRQLFGRLLPDVCGDFTDRGIVFDQLYTALRIPLDMVDYSLFEMKWRACRRLKVERYGLEVRREEEDGYLNSIRTRGWVDFGALSEDLQSGVIVRCLKEPSARKRLEEHNPFLPVSGDTMIDEERIERNSTIIEDVYSLEKNGARMMGIYGKVLEGSPVHRIDKSVLLRAFNKPEHNQLLLCEKSYA